LVISDEFEENGEWESFIGAPRIKAGWRAAVALAFEALKVRKDKFSS
jgi:hypothetical protein